MKQIKAIKRAIKAQNIANLKQLAVKHGFISDKLRKKAWPLVLGITNDDSQILDPPSKSISNTTDPQDPIEYRHIEQDIKRTLHYYNTNTDKQNKSIQSLSTILHGIFDDNDNMHYLQGFNDVTCVFHTVCNNISLSQKVSEKVAETLMSDFIMTNKRNVSENSVPAYKLIFNIIECDDKRLIKLLKNTHFIAISISWLITWFAHQIKDIKVISRIYDYCLCSDKLMPAYLSAALVIYLKHQLLALTTDATNTTLFEYFNHLKWDQLDFNQIIDISQSLYNKYNDAMRRMEANTNKEGDVWSMCDNDEVNCGERNDGDIHNEVMDDEDGSTSRVSGEGRNDNGTRDICNLVIRNIYNI